MNTLAKPWLESSKEKAVRRWYAKLLLDIERRGHHSVLTKTAHEGPLRVQRAFYPEDDGSCHIYLLHPPGGLVVGDDLNIAVNMRQRARALLTTPSAGKLYGLKNSVGIQSQKICFALEGDSCLEWLPQETIVFNGAIGRLATRVDLCDSAKIFTWDVVRLGRTASGEKFTQGSCHQNIEIWRDKKPLFMEKNRFDALSEITTAKWGLAESNTLGTLLATLRLERDDIDTLYKKLEDLTGEKCLWGLTQKEELFIARYLGDSITHCRSGFKLIWQETRPFLNGKQAVEPRIWNT